MNLIKTPVKGTRDITLKEMMIRENLLDLIKKTYHSYGYTNIETPILEHLENLTSNQGGENEKLIYKILKRGDKLDISNAKESNDLSDMGLRYDLTMPLSRFYANNTEELPTPLKTIQIGPVFRADKPQKGRFRQFYQCDIDIIGEASNLAEIDLIIASSDVLSQIINSDFEIHINDRRVLLAICLECDIKEEDYDKVYIALDKIEKVGADKVKEILISEGIDEGKVTKFIDLYNQISSINNILDIKKMLPNLEDDVIDSLSFIIDTVSSCNIKGLKIIFDPMIVRGMGYYTGTIFEIKSSQTNLSLGGGGRYDSVISKFTNIEAPACGFSIGFERLVVFLIENGKTYNYDSKSNAILIEKGVSKDKIKEVIIESYKNRNCDNHINILSMKKNKKKQKDDLVNLGTENIEEIFK